MHNTSRRTAGRRRGFTLLELMIVVLIIGILVAILVPVVGSVRTRALESQVRTEISSLEQAIAQFRAVYGIDPPSLITLCPDANGWDQNPRSKAVIRRMWPNFDFSGSGGLAPAVFPNGNPITFYGDECLVFFLGGVFDSSGAQRGFSTNPARPFGPPASPEETRKGPFFDFDVGRLVDNERSGGNPPRFVYIDVLAHRSGANSPYLYLSSSEGRTYDLSHIPPDPNNPGQPVMADVYRTGPGDDSATPPGSDAAPFKASSYQIIAPGRDGQYGRGGWFDPEDLDTSLAHNRTPAQAQAERDNITNFHGGRLAP